MIITLNEAENLPSLLDNLSFVDEIVILDSYSKDETEKIIRNFPKVRFYQKEFLDFADQRNYALSLTKNDWVLFLDADERIPDNLRTEILEVVENPKDFKAFSVKRQFYYKDKKLRFSGFQTDEVLRIFHKQFAHYLPEKKVHEKLQVRGKVKTLKHKLDHFSFADENAYHKKLNLYAKLRAEELFEQKMRPNFFHFQIKPVYRFLNHYVLRLGFLDGKKGLSIAKMQAKSIRERYRILEQKYRETT